MSARGDRLALLSLLADGTHPLELRWFTPTRAIKAFCVDPREADDQAERVTRAGCETFVGTLPRLGASGDAQRQYAPGSVLWADCDTERSVRKQAMFEPAPSIIVRSGGVDGFTPRQHVYWWLEQCVPADEIARHVRRLAAFLDADMASTDAARVLRVPGSVNRKTGGTARVVRLTDDRYTLDDLVGSLPDVPEATAHARTQGDSFAARVIPAGERHKALVSLLGSMRRWGAAEPVLEDAAESFCRRQCETDPAIPLDIAHAKRTARDVARRYPAGPACSWGMRR